MGVLSTSRSSRPLRSCAGFLAGVGINHDVISGHVSRWYHCLDECTDVADGDPSLGDQVGGDWEDVNLAVPDLQSASHVRLRATLSQLLGVGS